MLPATADSRAPLAFGQFVPPAFRSVLLRVSLAFILFYKMENDRDEATGEPSTKRRRTTQLALGSFGFTRNAVLLPLAPPPLPSFFCQYES